MSSSPAVESEVARISHQEARDQVLGPSFPEVSFQWFKIAVLPDVEDTKLAEVYDTLKNDQELSDEGWTGLEFEKLKRKGYGKGRAGTGEFYGSNPDRRGHVLQTAGWEIQQGPRAYRGSDW
uniref:Uncharacterized protein n=1 Tax=Moniliophthora roreri TaxID=221103 RepID=A0A0W0F0C6_MONRR